MTMTGTPSMRVCFILGGFFAFLECCGAAEKPSKDQLISETRRIAGATVAISSGNVLYKSWPRGDDLGPPEWQAVWQVIHSLAQQPEAAEELVRDHDAKVRTLALLGLYDTEDPRFLPLIAGSLTDTSEAFKEPAPRHQVLTAMPMPMYEDKAVTVGRIAADIINRHLMCSGARTVWSTGGKIERKSFDEFWKKHAGRPSYAGLWQLKVDRARAGSNPVPKGRYEEMEAVRHGVEALPSPDRELTLLWLWTGQRSWTAGERSGERWLSDDELVDTAKKLGRKTLLDLLAGQVPSDDPDLQPASRGEYDAGSRVILFILEQAPRLLQKGDATELLRLEAGTAALRSAQWSIAAARLDSHRSVKILNDAFRRFTREGSSDAHNRSLLAIALWKTAGIKARAQLVDWFYSEQSILGLNYHELAPFFDAISGREVVARPLLKAIIADRRLERMGFGPLTVLVETAGILNGAEIVPPREMSDLGPRGGKGGEHFPTVEDFRLKHPDECAKMELAMTDWRKRLRGTAKQW